jgi:hypothetical protein
MLPSAAPASVCTSTCQAPAAGIVRRDCVDHSFEPTGKVSRSRLNKLVDALKTLGDIPQDFSVETLFLPGITQTAN